jgi:hypothetical protein
MRPGKHSSLLPQQDAVEVGGFRPTYLSVRIAWVRRQSLEVYGRLAQASSAGRMSGSSQLTLELTDIVINDTAYPLLTSTHEIKGKGEGKKTQERF